MVRNLPGWRSGAVLYKTNPPENTSVFPGGPAVCLSIRIYRISDTESY